MSKVIMLSRTFPAYHTKKGEPTEFINKIWKSLGSYAFKPSHNITDWLYTSNPNFHKDEILKFEIHLRQNFDEYCAMSPKHHTIRSGKRWKTGDTASIRVWSGKPYGSKQIIIAPDVELTVKDFEIDGSMVRIDGKLYCLLAGNDQYDTLALNDGLSPEDFQDWFNKPVFHGQILIWNNSNLPY